MHTLMHMGSIDCPTPLLHPGGTGPAPPPHPGSAGSGASSCHGSYSSTSSSAASGCSSLQGGEREGGGGVSSQEGMFILALGGVWEGGMSRRSLARGALATVGGGEACGVARVGGKVGEAELASSDESE